MTLLREFQSVLERTYGPSGVDLEACLIGPSRSHQLASLAGAPAGLSLDARTYLRFHGGNLHIAIYYAPSLIERLEQENPRESISHRNIAALIAFAEEITHGIHAALAFRRGGCRLDSEQFACALEAQAKVDVYYLLLRLGTLLAGELMDDYRHWLRLQILEGHNDFPDPRLRRRYALASRIAGNFIRRADRMNARRRIRAIRDFRECSLPRKARLARQTS